MAIAPESIHIKGILGRSVDFYDTPLKGTTPNVTGLLVDGAIGAKGKLCVQCKVDTVVHGTMTDGPDAVPASLICYQFNFFPLSNHRRFTTANITLQFTSGTVTKVVPDGQHELSPDKRTHGITSGLSASLPISTSTLAFNLSDTETFLQTAYMSFTGTANHVSRDEADTASWSMNENPQSHDGIPSTVNTAVLLQHDAADTTGKFEAKLKINCDVHATLEDRLKIDGFPGSRTDKEEEEADKGKASEHVMTLYYDTAQKSTNPDKIDAKNLGAVNMAGYGKIITFIFDDDSKNGPAGTPAAGATGAPAAGTPAAPAAGAA